MNARVLMLCACIVATSGYLGYAARAEPTPIRQSLSGLPLNVGEWRGRRNADFTPEILKVLRVDDYTTRSYTSPHGWVGLYIGYHASQRHGASIHSPLNCIPGAGWIPTEQSKVTLHVHNTAAGDPRTIEVNRVVIEKGLERQLVLYWYQSHGRVVASEYWGKAYSVLDAIRYNRTDAALVRVIAPIDGENHAGAVAAAEVLASDFIRTIFPLLGDYLPS